ncbi:hypothetical protein [Arthrobacter sp. zg-Y877]|uniref:hypothetical protein n=1 Tax=Arthrobacter sp. zg-Y877 TaxID=3049074 RepID=UPI0025A4A1E0|nr:hypothetical protein [Arthrobacter sp. zg-Y877]MDM7990715.1 hypothetical protein [Arthrobacter sp. zg-Y877]
MPFLDHESLLPLSVRGRNTLERAYLQTNGDLYALAQLTVADLVNLPQVGPATVMEVMTVVGEALIVQEWIEEDAAHEEVGQASETGALPRPVPEERWVLPAELPLPADEVSSEDARFRRYLGEASTLEDAARAGTIPQETGEELIKYLSEIEQLPLEEAVQDLVFSACAGNPAASSRNDQQDISLENGWRMAITARFGLAGELPVTLDQAAKFVPSKRYPAEFVTRERIRQQCDKLSARLPESPWIPALHRALQVIVEASPVAAPRVGELLAPHGLSHFELRAEALLAMVQLTRTDVEAVTGATLEIRDGWLCDVSRTAALAAPSVVGKHTSKYGLTTVEEIRQELSDKQPATDDATIDRILRATPNIRWTSDGWLWASGGQISSLHTNTLRNHARNILSVNAPQSVESVYEGFKRAQKFRDRDIVPSLTAVTEFLSDHPEFKLSSGHVDLVEPVDYQDALGPVAAQMVDVLKASPFGVMDRTSLVEQCTAAGISKGTIGVWTTYAEWMQTFGRNVWGLRGTAVAPSIIEEIQAAAVQRSRSERRERSWTWSPEGHLVLVADVNTLLWTTGVINFPSSLRRTVGARRFTIEHSQGFGGELSLSGEHDWSWGWGRSLKVLQAKVGDRIRATVDLSSGVANLEVGDRYSFPTE